VTEHKEVDAFCDLAWLLRLLLTAGTQAQAEEKRVLPIGVGTHAVTPAGLPTRENGI